MSQTDELRKALEAKAKEWEQIEDAYHGHLLQFKVAALSLRKILDAHPPEPAEGTGLREALEKIRAMKGIYLPDFYNRVMIIVDAALRAQPPKETT